MQGPAPQPPAAARNDRKGLCGTCFDDPLTTWVLCNSLDDCCRTVAGCCDCTCSNLGRGAQCLLDCGSTACGLFGNCVANSLECCLHIVTCPLTACGACCECCCACLGACAS